MRPLVPVFGWWLFVSVACVPRVGTPSPSAVSAASRVGIAANTVGRIDATGNLLVLVTLTNRGNERLVVEAGGTDDDWFSSFTIEAKTSGMMGNLFISDGPAPGDIACPHPEFDLILPPGSGVGRLQRLELGGDIDGGVTRMKLDVRLWLSPSSLRCGPLELLARTVDVAFDRDAFGRH